MLDVHPPHESIHGWRDFLLHLFTITIGLLIALSLEGCVEWQHHRHLVHDAEASLHTEIGINAASLKDEVAKIRKEQANLKHAVTVLKYVRLNHKFPEHDSMEIDYHMQAFPDISWKTAQTTGALAYMSYGTAQEYANIYNTQQDLISAQQLAARDAVAALGPVNNFSDSDPTLTPEQVNVMQDHIETLQGQLVLVEALISSLDGEYKKFLAAHS